MTTARRAPLLALPALLLACSDDGGRDTDTATSVTTVPTVPTTPTAPSTDSDTATPTTAADSTAGEVDPTLDTTPSATEIDTSTTSADSTGVITLPETTSFPGELRCSDDLHSVIDEDNVVVEECPPAEACYDGACIPACDAVAQLEGTVGCDFWAPAPPFLSNGGGSTLDGPCFAVFVANAWTGPANITVTRGGQSFDVN